eukprot:IDg17447t1
MYRTPAFTTLISPPSWHTGRLHKVCKTKCCAASALPERVPLLRMEEVYYSVPMDFENIVFTSLNFAVYPGEFVVVTGQNGSGKSTAMQLMAGLKTAESGKIFWKGSEQKRRGALVKNVGVVMQSPGDYFLLPTILQELVQFRPSRTPDDVRRVMKWVGLPNVSLLTNPRKLSGGQTRRLALASQLMREPVPELFVLDEPLVGVDWAGREELVDVLGQLKSQFAVVVVSHEPAELLHFADRVLQVARGRMHEVERSIIDNAIRIQQDRRSAAVKNEVESRKQPFKSSVSTLTMAGGSEHKRKGKKKAPNPSSLISAPITVHRAQSKRKWAADDLPIQHSLRALDETWAAFTADVDRELATLREPALDAISAAVSSPPPHGSLVAVCVLMRSGAVGGDRDTIFSSVVRHLERGADV